MVQSRAHGLKYVRKNSADMSDAHNGRYDGRYDGKFETQPNTPAHWPKKAAFKGDIGRIRRTFRWGMQHN